MLASVADQGGAGPVVAARRAAHKLSGIGGMLGFPAVSEHAARLEGALSTTPVDLPIAQEALAGIAAGFVTGLDSDPPEWASDANAASAARILIVEDETGPERVANLGLIAAGFQVITAWDGPAALRLARSEQPDLIVLDLDLPELDGLAVCQQLKLDPDVSAIPIVLVTAHDALIDRMSGLAIGFDDYLRKPIASGELLVRIRRLLAAHRPALDYHTDSAAVAAPTVLPYEEFSIIARDMIGSGPAALLLLRAPPSMVESVAERLIAELRRRDLCGRYSPAHLIVLAPGLTAADGRGVVDRILSDLPEPDQRRVVVGVVETAGGPEAAAGFDALVARADLSLSEARVERSGGSARPTVLIAEDDPDVLQIIDARLQSAGYRTVMAFDGEEALALAKRELPDVMLLDLMMPKLTGFEVLTGLRDMGDSRPQTIVVSARERDADVTRAFDLGADDYVSKPFNPDELVARIARLLR